MTLILLKERSSWLRFFSWRSASLGTSLKEFRATFKRSRSLVRGAVSPDRLLRDLGKPFLWSTDASTMFPGKLGPIRARQRNPFKRILTNSAVWSTRPSSAFSRTQNGSCQNQIRCRKTLEQNLMFLHSLLFCPFQTFGDRITG